MATPKVRAGSEVLMKTEVYNTIPKPPVLADPDTSLKLYLMDPTGAVILNGVDADRISTGLYSYVYQTDISSELGLWTLYWAAINNGNTTESLTQVAFQLLEA